MKPLALVAVFAVAGAALLALSNSGRAQENTCVLQCNTAKKGCLEAARVDALACKQDCRDTAAPTERGACNRACADEFRGKKEACRADHKTCHEGCGGKPEGTPGSGPPEGKDCLKGCDKEAAGCVRDGVKSSKACTRDCKKAADPAGCLQGCAESVKGLSAACAADLETCRANCSGPPPTPSVAPGT